MSESKHLTSPPPISEMPKGVPYIVGNEAAERFSFYGMRAILFVFMTKYLLDAAGEPDLMSEPEATARMHSFMALAYATPMLGALLSDVVLGKYRTIMLLSIVYCFGHFMLAIDDTRFGLSIGLALIALGAGGIKPCVSAHVGDQFGAMNSHLMPKVFAWFYFSINLGSTISTLLTPLLLEGFSLQASIPVFGEVDWTVPGSAAVAFGVPGGLMALATFVFWLGRNKFVHVPPGGVAFLKEAFSREGRIAFGKLAFLYVCIIPFWALFDQSTSRWVGQAEKMDRTWMNIEWKASQLQAVNPILVMVFIPLFSYVIYPAVERVVALNPLRKISCGLFVAVTSFIVPAFVESWIDAGRTPSIEWQILAYILLTAAEVMIVITALEFSYTQAPRKLKSFVMALFWLSVAVGNLFTALVNDWIGDDAASTKLEGADYYWFFVGLMAVSATAFVFVAMKFPQRTYLQDDV